MTKRAFEPRAGVTAAAVAAVLPLTQAVAIARPLMNGAVPSELLLHLGILLAYGLAGFQLALAFTRNRLLR